MGRSMPLSAGNAINFMITIGKCRTCSLAYPKPVQVSKRMRVAGAVRVKSYTNISIDNVTLGSIKPHPQSRFDI